MELLDHYVYKNIHRIIDVSTQTLQFLIIPLQDCLHQFHQHPLSYWAHSRNEHILGYLLIFQLYGLVFSFLFSDLNYGNACLTSFYWSIHRDSPRAKYFLIYFWFWNQPYFLVCLIIPNQNHLLVGFIVLLVLYLRNLLMSRNYLFRREIFSSLLLIRILKNKYSK